MPHAPLVGNPELAELDQSVQPLRFSGGTEQAGRVVEVLDLDRRRPDCPQGPTQPETTDNQDGPKPLSTGPVRDGFVGGSHAP